LPIGITEKLVVSLPGRVERKVVNFQILAVQQKPVAGPLFPLYAGKVRRPDMPGSIARLFASFLTAFFTFLLAQNAFASAFSGNTVDDMFAVKKVENGQAELEGKAKGLKAGDILYFIRAPYQFTVKSVHGDSVIVVLPEGAHLEKGNSLVRHQTDQMRKMQQTEMNLKNALED
jgi:hypothetical protein